jgi:ArsR family transcriptional regulator
LDGSHRIRALSAERGLDWDHVTEEGHKWLIDELLHEDELRFDIRGILDIIQRMLNYMPPTIEPSSRQATGLGDNELVRMLKALADPSRLSIFNMLMEGVQCNCEIAGRLGFSLSLISHHLRVLREVGLVEAERDEQDARWIYYAIHREKLAQLDASVRHLLDANRIQPRLPSCGPKSCATC